MNGELAPDARQAIDGHLGDCGRCAQVVARAVTASPETPQDEAARRGDDTRGDLIDRYVVLDRIGHGATGVIYAAYDPKLDRRIAVKTLRRTSPALEERLLREAQTMARLSSPYVVAVHDAGRFEGGVFIAMDLVEGATLRTWLAARRRAWPEVVRAFVQAGHGLAAAHRAGIVHRDFKPDNVLVRSDDRVAVTDFGLARLQAEPDAAPIDWDRVSPAAHPRLTATGAILGTPAYMAPEQREGKPVDARTDLFAFCVALYEALYGVHPFPMSSLAARAGAAASGEVRPPPDAKVPRHLRDAVLAGLRAAPADRPASMEVLLARLEHDPRRRRRMVGLAGLALAGVGATLALAPRAATPGPRCPEATLEDVWGPDRRAAFAATGSPRAEDAATAVTRTFAAYAAAWRAEHRAACEATHVRGVQSSAILDRRMACLAESRLRWLALGAALAHPTAAVVEAAPLAAYGLPDVSACGSPRRLAQPAPEEPALTDRPLVALARINVARARTLSFVGDGQRGVRELAPALEVVRVTGYRPLEAEVLLAAGLARQPRDPKAAERALRDAAVAAGRIGRVDLAAQALNRLVWNLGWLQMRTDDALMWAGFAGAAGEQSGDELLRAELLMSLGATLTKAGLEALALPLYHEAAAIFERKLGATHPNVARALSEQGLALTGVRRAGEALPVLRRARAIWRDLLGAGSNEVGAADQNLAVALWSLGRYDEATALLTEILTRLEATLGPEHVRLASLLSNISHGQREAGRLRAAAGSARRALALVERAYGHDHPQLLYALIQLARALAALGEHAEADAVSARAVDIAGARLEPSQHTSVEAFAGRGLVLVSAGRCREATALYRRLLPLAERAGYAEAWQAENHLGVCARREGRLDDAEAHFERGRALHGTGADVDRRDLVESLLGHAETRLARRDVPGARALLDRALAEAATLPAPRRSAAHFLRARVDPHLGQADAALALALVRDLPDLPLRRELEAWIASPKAWTRTQP